ncbi:MAG: glycosyltransferase, partial [Nostoc sp.]
MPANSWPEEDSYQELDPLNSLLSDLSANEESVLETDPVSLTPRFQGRRRKAALVLTIVWSGTIALHLVSWASIFILGLTT